jgi:hypothetical protein
MRRLDFLKSPQPIDRFLLKKCKTFSSPQPGLSDVTFLAFVLAEIYYSSWLSGKAKALEHLIACFYNSSLGFRRGHFIELNAEILNASKEILHPDDEQFYKAILLNYENIRLWLRSKYPLIFHLVEDPSGEEQTLWFRWVHFLDPYIIKSNYKFKIRSDRSMHSILEQLNEKIKIAFENGRKDITYEYLDSFDAEEIFKCSNN